jgi:hypothetical protein
MAVVGPHLRVRPKSGPTHGFPVPSLQSYRLESEFVLRVRIQVGITPICKQIGSFSKSTVVLAEKSYSFNIVLASRRNVHRCGGIPVTSSVYAEALLRLKASQASCQEPNRLYRGSIVCHASRCNSGKWNEEEQRQRERRTEENRATSP